MPSQPRITHVVRQFWPQQGGLEESIRQLCVTLRGDFGADADVVTLDRTFGDGAHHPAAAVVDGVPVRRLRYYGSQRYPLAPEFLAATADADLIHVHGIDFFFDGFAVSRLFRGKPLVASTHGGFFHTPFAARLKRAYFGSVTRAACRAYDLIGASSVGDAERFRSIAGTRVEVIENGVDIAKWANAASPGFTRTMIAIGRWSGNKNLAALFPLLARLRDDHPGWRLIIAGNPHDVTHGALSAWAAAHGVGEAVEIHIGPDTAELARLIGRASFFVSLSDYEGFGLAAIEALSAGLVPILSDIANYRLFIDRAGIGCIVGGDAVAAAARIVALADAVAAGHAGCRAQAIAAAQRYGWHDVAARWMEVYAAALARAGRADAA